MKRFILGIIIGVFSTIYFKDDNSTTQIDMEQMQNTLQLETLKSQMNEIKRLIENAESALK